MLNFISRRSDLSLLETTIKSLILDEAILVRSHWLVNA
jgi:hypothetical protein